MEQKRLQREVDDLEAQVRKLQSAAEDEESRDLHSKEFARLRVRSGGMCWVRHFWLGATHLWVRQTGKCICGRLGGCGACNLC